MEWHKGHPRRIGSEEKVRIAIDLKTGGANPQNVLNNLYKYTDLEKLFISMSLLWWTAFSLKF